MNLTMLTTLCTIVKHGSFTAAAQVVGCSPSAVSLQVKQLERYFGQPMFDRSTRKVVPTSFALMLAGSVGEFAGRIQSLRMRPTAEVAGLMRLGVLNSMQSEVLPQVLAMLRQRHPALQVAIPPLTNTNQLLTELKAGSVDMALLVHSDSGGSRRLVWRELHRQPYVLLAPESAPAQSPRELLETLPLVGYDVALPGGRVAARYVRDVAPQVRCAMELQSVDAIVAMVAAGLGVTVVPQPRRPLLDAYQVREVPLGPKGPVRRLSLAWRSADDGSRNNEAVATIFAEAFENLGRARGGDSTGPAERALLHQPAPRGRSAAKAAPSA